MNNGHTSDASDMDGDFLGERIGNGSITTSAAEGARTDTDEMFPEAEEIEHREDGGRENLDMSSGNWGGKVLSSMPTDSPEVAAQKELLKGGVELGEKGLNDEILAGNRGEKVSLIGGFANNGESLHSDRGKRLKSDRGEGLKADRGAPEKETLDSGTHDRENNRNNVLEALSKNTRPERTGAKSSKNKDSTEKTQPKPAEIIEGSLNLKINDMTDDKGMTEAGFGVIDDITNKTLDKLKDPADYYNQIQALRKKFRDESMGRPG